MDSHKIKLKLLIALLHLLRIASAALGCFGVVGNLIVIVQHCSPFSRASMENENHGPSQLDAFYEQYDRFFPQKDTDLDIELSKMKNDIELLLEVVKAQQQLFEAVCNDERYAYYVDQVIEVSKQSCEAQERQKFE